MIDSKWPLVPINNFAQQVKRPIALKADQFYRTMGVRLWGKGAYERETKSGNEIKASKMFIVRTGDLIINRIWAQKGSCGVIEKALDGCVVTQDFPVFQLDQSRVLFDWMTYISQSQWFWEGCEEKSRGTSGRERIQTEDFLNIKVPLPPLEDQRRIVEKIKAVHQKMNEIYALQEITEQRIVDAINSLISSLAVECDRKALREVAPLIRRHIKIDPECEYPELGIRSFGKGTFHKPPIRGNELNGKHLFKIEPEDLLFNNVFAWEGAVAVAQPEDIGRYGSHRFISRKPIEGVASADFLFYYFITPEGIEQLGKASPGSAGRNRTLGLKMLDEIEVPLPSYEKQVWIVSIAERLEQLGKRQAVIKDEMEGLFKSVLDRAFQGKL